MIISKEHFDKIYRENSVQCTCLVLILNDECNASCKACIAQHIFKSPLCKELCEAYDAKCLRCCSHKASDEEFYRSVEEILKTVNSPIVDIIITGGEPTISNRLIPTLELIEKYNFPIKTLEIETNGARLDENEIAAALKKHNVIIHLSRYGKTDEENTAEFNYADYPVDAGRIKGFAEIYKEQLGISTVLLNHHIGSAADLLDTIDFYRGLGVTHFAFLEVMADTSLRKANKALLEYYDAHHIPILELSAGLEELGAEKLSEEGDESYRIIRHLYKGIEFTLTSSNLDKQHKQETNNGFSRFLIMPSGEIGVNGIEKR